MQPVSLVMAVILMGVALTGRKGRLIALALAWLAVYPAIQPLGLRSAVFVPELVIAAALVPWLLRSRKYDLPGAPKWFAPQMVFLVFWVAFVTSFGLVEVGAAKEAHYRTLMAVLRVSAALLSFAIPAATMVNDRDFRAILRVLRYACFVLLAVALIDYMHVLPIRFYFQATEAASEESYGLARSGGMTRSGLGGLAVVAISVLLLSVQLRQGARALSLAALVGFIVVLLLTRSRSDLVAVMTMALVLIGLHRGNRMRNLVLVAIGFGTVYVVAMSIPIVAERLETLTSMERAVRTSGRVHGWKQAVSFLISNPLTAVIGVGYDCWGRRLKDICQLANGHNVYLHAVAELGLIGAAAYLSIFARLALQFFRVMRYSGDGRIVGGTALALVVGLAASNLTNVGLYPILVRLTAVHVTLFTLGLAYGRVRYVLAEQRALRTAAAVSQPTAAEPAGRPAYA